MTPQESQLLQGFLTQLVEAGGLPKDRDADELIQRAARAQPDALYLLVQRALIQQQALEAAQRRIDVLESGAAAKRSQAASSFLSNDGWGRSAASGSASRPAQQGSLASEAAAFAARSGQAPAGLRGPGGGVNGAAPGQLAAAPGAGSRGGSFLGQAAAMAAGVAGGAFLFHGIGSLLGQNADGGNASVSPGGFEPVTEDATAHGAGSAQQDAGGVSDHSADAGGSADYADADFRDADPGGDDFAGDFGDDGGDFA